MIVEVVLVVFENFENKMVNIVFVFEGSMIVLFLFGMVEIFGILFEDFEVVVKDLLVYGVDVLSFEGWLFFVVYEFDLGVIVLQVIQWMVDCMWELFVVVGVLVGDEEWVFMIVLIIQCEGWLDDFLKVLCVIQNCFDIDMKLQMDLMVQYGYGLLYEGVVFSFKEVFESDNLWNMYVYMGLLVMLIVVFSDVVIKVVMQLVDGLWFYFVMINFVMGEMQFLEIFVEYEQGIEKWCEWCWVNFDGGC